MVNKQGLTLREGDMKNMKEKVKDMSFRISDKGFQITVRLPMGKS